MIPEGSGQRSGFDCAHKPEMLSVISVLDHTLWQPTEDTLCSLF
jgi:hypothetical protein